MTTKKQRREQTAERTRLAREALAAENLAALERSRNKREQARWEKERAENKKAATEAMAKEKEPEVIPDNLKEAYDNAIVRSGQADFGISQNMSNA